MKIEDFHIGLEFYDNGSMTPAKWRCTDVGKRVIVAIRLDKEDTSWYNGPPYAVQEVVFDENDLEACDLHLE